MARQTTDRPRRGGMAGRWRRMGGWASSAVDAGLTLAAIGFVALLWRAAEIETTPGALLRSVAERAEARLMGRPGETAPLPRISRLVRTGLHLVRIDQAGLGTYGSPAAVEAVEGGFLVVMRDGRFLLSDGTGRSRQLAPRIEMGAAALHRHPGWRHPGLLRSQFKVADLHLHGEGSARAAFVSHHRFEAGDGCIRLVLSRVALGEDGLPTGAPRELRAFEPCVTVASDPMSDGFDGSQAGGRMATGPDGRLLLTLGDHGIDGVTRHTELGLVPQDPDAEAGRIWAIDPATGEGEVVSIGHRNPQGLTVSRDGRIWSTEHGPRGGDELNLIEPGANYGWPHVILGTRYTGAPWPLSERPGWHDGYRWPVFAWLPSIAVSQLAEAVGPEFPGWEGDLLVSSLRARHLFRLRLAEGRVIYAEPIEIGRRIRDMVVMADGKLVLLTDSGRLLTLSNADAGRPGTAASVAAAAGAATGAREAALPRVVADTPGARAFAERCAACHALAPRHGKGPHLAGLATRGIGAAPGYPYSAALTEAAGQWDAARLRRYLRAPEALYPGTAKRAIPLGRSGSGEIAAFLGLD